MISAKPMGLSLGNFVGMTSGDDMRRGVVAAAVGERPCPARALAKQHDGLVADALGQWLVAADLIRPGRAKALRNRIRSLLSVTQVGPHRG